MSVVGGVGTKIRGIWMMGEIQSTERVQSEYGALNCTKIVWQVKYINLQVKEASELW